MKSVEIKIYGKVQGVFFRQFTKNKARDLGLMGFVKNMHDGSVYAITAGDEGNIRQFIEWCHKGSPLSKVDRVEVTQLENADFSGFEIR